MEKIKQLQDMVALIYTVLYKDSSWKLLQTTRKEPHMKYKHILRYILYYTYNLTLKQVANIEGGVLNIAPPHHSSVLYSINIVNKHLKNSKEFNFISGIIQKLDYLQNSQPQRETQLERFFKLKKKHQKDIIRLLLTAGTLPLDSLKLEIDLMLLWEQERK